MNIQHHNKQLSITKAIGIILVVIGHSGCPELLNSYIYLFHMPLFYMASGYFYKESYVQHKKEFILKRIKGLYVPFIKWGLIFIVLHNLLGRMHLININGEGYETYYNLLMYLKAIRAVITLAMPECLMGPLWFLESLFVSSILLLLLDYIVSLVSLGRKRRVIVFTITLILLIIAFITTDVLKITLPRGLCRDLGCINLIYMGYLFTKVQNKLSYRPLFSIFYTFLLFTIAYTWGTISVVDFTIRNPIIFGICAIIGWYSLMGIAKQIEQCHNSISDFFDYMGQHTITILIFHILAFKLTTLVIIFTSDLPIGMLANFPIISPNGLWWIIYSIVGVSIPLAIAWGIEYKKRKKPYLK